MFTSRYGLNLSTQFGLIFLSTSPHLLHFQALENLPPVFFYKRRADTAWEPSEQKMLFSLSSSSVEPLTAPPLLVLSTSSNGQPLRHESSCSGSRSHILNRVAYQMEIQDGPDVLPASPTTKNTGTGTVGQVGHSNCKTSDDLGEAGKTCEAEQAILPTL